MKFSVVVPCYIKHITYLPEVLGYINNQTLKPIEIVLAISSIPPNKTDEIKELCTKCSEIPLKFTIIEGMALAGINRNRGAELCEGDWIAFMDCDDIYHPQKLEMTAWIINKYNPTLVLHSYMKERCGVPMKERFDVKKGVRFVPSWKTWLHTFGYESYDDGVCPSIRAGVSVHHGHITVRRDLCNKYKFPPRRKGEDGRFCRKVFFGEGGLIVMKEILTLYRR